MNLNKKLFQKNSVVLSLIMICLYYIVFYNNSYMYFWDNEELYLLATIDKSFLTYITEKLPYHLYSTANFWASTNFIGTDMSSIRLLSNTISCVLVLYLVFIFSKKVSNINIILVVILFLMFNERFFVFYSNWGVVSYIGMLFLSLIIMHIFYNISVNGFEENKYFYMLVLFFSFFMHADLLIVYGAGFLASLIINYRKNNNLINLVKSSYYYVFPGLLYIFIVFYFFNIQKELHRSHLDYLIFFNQNNFEHNFFGWFEFIHSRLIYISNEFTIGYLHPILKDNFSVIWIFALLIIVTTMFIKKFEEFNNYKTFKLYILIILASSIFFVLLLNLLGIHHFGQIRYSLFLIFPVLFILAIGVFELIYIFLYFLSKLYNKINIELLVNMTIQVLFVVFSVIALLNIYSHKNIIINNIFNIENQILNSKYNIALCDVKYLSRMKQDFEDKMILNIGTSVVGRHKGIPTNSETNTILNQKIIITVTFQKPITDVGSYPGYSELITKNFTLQKQFVTERGVLFTLYKRKDENK